MISKLLLPKGDGRRPCSFQDWSAVSYIRRVDASNHQLSCWPRPRSPGSHRPKSSFVFVMNDKHSTPLLFGQTKVANWVAKQLKQSTGVICDTSLAVAFCTRKHVPPPHPRWSA